MTLIPARRLRRRSGRARRPIGCPLPQPENVAGPCRSLDPAPLRGPPLVDLRIFGSSGRSSGARRCRRRPRLRRRQRVQGAGFVGIGVAGLHGRIRPSGRNPSAGPGTARTGVFSGTRRRFSRIPHPCSPVARASAGQRPRWCTPRSRRRRAVPAVSSCRTSGRAGRAWRKRTPGDDPVAVRQPKIGLPGNAVGDQDLVRKLRHLDFSRGGYRHIYISCAGTGSAPRRHDGR